MTLKVEYEKKGDSPEEGRREAMIAPHGSTITTDDEAIASAPL